ncbi:MAG: PKD domain-containing protein [Salibacteraceae bacterium]
MRGLITLILALGYSLISVSQTHQDTVNNPLWIDMMQDPTVKFTETQNAFETYWKGKKRSKGDGYKPFKRWEWFMQYELKENGAIRSAEEIQQEVRKFQLTYGSFTPPGAGSRAGATTGKWKSLGPIQKAKASSGQPNGMGRINAIGIHPSDNDIIFVGSPNGGIWRTYDGGSTWTSNTDTNFVMQISSIIFDPVTPTIVYAGTGDRDAGARSPRGVMKSTDGGVTWSVSNSGMGNVVVGKLIIHPTQTNILVAATSNGIYRSTNSGASWTRTSSSTNHFKELVENPIDFNIQFAGQGSAYYRSTDGGQSWTKITLPVNGNRLAIGVTQDDPSYVYIVQCSQRAFAGMMLSTDTGKTFTTQSTSPNIMDWSTNGSGTGGQAWYDLDIAVDPKNKAHIYVGGVNVFKSTNSGKNWSINSHWTGSGGVPAVHADHHVFEWSADGTILYDGSDGGVARTTNGGPNWTDISSGLAISEVYKIGQHSFNENRVICGYQDNGSAIYRGAGDWTTEIGGDGMECAFDDQNNSYVYGALYYGAIRRSSNGGSTFNSITGGISEQGAWVTPYILEEGNTNTMFVGMTNYVWRNSNVRTGQSWKSISPNVSTAGGAWSVLESSQADNNILYAVRSGKRLFRTDNANASNPTWTDLTSGLPSGDTPSDMEAHPLIDSIVYMTAGANVYVSTDKGASWMNITGNLPGTAKRTIAYDKFSPGGIYVGGTPNVYYIDSSMTDWVEYSYGLPGDVSVTEIEMFYDLNNPTNSQLRAGTYGRGLWSIELFDIENREPLAVLRGDSGNYCISQTIKMYGDSSKKASEYKWVINPSTGFSFINGTTSTSKNIELAFSKQGFYNISFIAKNYFGADTVELNNGIVISNDSNQYCSTTTASIVPSGFGITRIQLEDIDNNSGSYMGSVSNQNFFCTDLTRLKLDSTYRITVTTAGSEYVKAFIDYNNDSDFNDSGEEIGTLNMGSGSRSISFKTPLSSTINEALRMRIISDSSPIQNSCASLTNGESEDYAVFIDEPQVTFSYSDTIICPNETVTISGEFTGKIDSIVWDFGVNSIPQMAYGSGPHDAKYNGTGKWPISIKINDGVWFYDTINVEKSLLADLLLDSANSSLCEGGYARLLVKNNTGISGRYTWFVNNSVDTSLTDSVYYQNNLNAFIQYDYLVVTDNGFCFDTSEVLTVKPFDTPTAWAKVNRARQCFHENVYNYEDITQILGGATLSREWNLGDGTIDTNKLVKHSYSSVGVYNSSLISNTNWGCSDTTYLSVTLLPSPDSTFNYSNASGSTVGFTPNDTSSSATYIWEFGDGDTSWQKTPSHTYGTSGSFKATLTVKNGDNCTSTSSQGINIESGISVEEFSSMYGVSVFPNPANGATRLQVNSENEVNSELYNIQGKLIETYDLGAADNAIKVELPSQGTYLLRVSINGKSATYTIENQ